jgi:putative hydrolase of the HAD superfamily
VSAIRAVLLDALGTLVRLEAPAPALRAALMQRTGVDVGLPAAEHAFGAEIAYYRAHHLEGDEQGLEGLRDDCAQVMRAALADPALAHAQVRAAMLDALEFTPFDDVVPALTRLRGRGLRLVVVSNWDAALSHWLKRAGLLDLLDGAVSSAQVRAAKPDPAPLLAGLALAGTTARATVHVGDSAEHDVEGARAAAIRPILIRRGERPAPPGVESITSLAGLAPLL